MKKASPTVIAFLVFTFILAGSAILFNRYDGLSFAQEGGIQQASKRAKELAAEAQGLVTEAENKLAVARVALQSARSRGDREAEQAILTAMSKLKSDVNSARKVADNAMDIAGKVENSKTAAGAAAAVNSIRASINAIQTVSNSVSATMSLVVALGAGDINAAQIADNLSGRTDEAAQKALNLASKSLKAAEGALTTSDEGEAARVSEQAKAAVQKAAELSSASKTASQQAERATYQAAAALGMAPPPTGGGEEAISEIASNWVEEAAREISNVGSEETALTPVITGFTESGNVSGSGAVEQKIFIYGDNFIGDVSVSLGPGITVTKVNRISNKVLEVFFRVDTSSPGFSVESRQITVVNLDTNNSTTFPMHLQLGTSLAGEPRASIVK